MVGVAEGGGGAVVVEQIKRVVNVGTQWNLSCLAVEITIVEHVSFPLSLQLTVWLTQHGEYLLMSDISEIQRKDFISSPPLFKKFSIFFLNIIRHWIVYLLQGESAGGGKKRGEIGEPTRFAKWN